MFVSSCGWNLAAFVARQPAHSGSRVERPSWCCDEGSRAVADPHSLLDQARLWYRSVVCACCAINFAVKNDMNDILVIEAAHCETHADMAAARE
jgi:hypothetical protein